MTLSKLDQIHLVLDRCPEIRDWYVRQHGLNPDDLTHQSIHEYGLGGLGDLADAILAEPSVQSLLTELGEAN
ncbi:MAG: hypothetical protein ACREM3_18585 [Candidatus Rokuibacteriota bacterium]